MSFLLANVPDRAPFDITDLNQPRLNRIETAIQPLGRAIRNPTAAYDIVFDLSGTERGLRSACQSVTPGGRLCTLSHLPSASQTDFLLEEILHRDVTFTASYLDGGDSNLAFSMHLLESRWTSSWSSLLAIQPLDALPQLLETRAASFANKTILDMTMLSCGEP
jgi:threonine dehydrogenase-like Zn-dependent dehydrogenase